MQTPKKKKGRNYTHKSKILSVVVGPLPLLRQMPTSSKMATQNKRAFTVTTDALSGATPWVCTLTQLPYMQLITYFKPR